jgi:phosphotransferase system  glucose/maltose/N-acetylglucosamine-specific IIC component
MRDQTVLQEPIFSIFMAIVFVAIALLVWNVIEVVRNQYPGAGMTALTGRMEPLGSKKTA